VKEKRNPLSDQLFGKRGKTRKAHRQGRRGTWPATRFDLLTNLELKGMLESQLEPNERRSRKTMSGRFTLTCICVGLLNATPCTGEVLDFCFRHEHVLGTSLELRIEAATAEMAAEVERTSLAEIERLAKALSGYDAESEFMRWQSSEADAEKLSRDLAAVLARAEHWRTATGGAFDVRAAAIADLWKQAAALGGAPSDAERRTLIAKLANPPYELAPADVVRRNDSLPLTLDGLAKGYILDVVCQTVAARHPETRNFTINIGGDLRKMGEKPLRVSLADPADASEGAAPLETISLTPAFAMATSGNYRRYLTVAGRRYSHIVDPRTGLPAEDVASATVIAPTAIDADALATAVSVLAPEEGLALIESLEDVECRLVLAGGRRLATRGWPSSSAPRLQFVSTSGDRKPGLWVHFTLNRPEEGIYRRPYVAIWLEDGDGVPVKTALLWIKTDGSGPTWHREISRWYRKDGTRKLTENTDLIGTISGATRGPGEYQARFDGTDNTGKPLPHGKYRLYLEVAREYGSYRLIRAPVEITGRAIARTELKSNVEIGNAWYEYVPDPADEASKTP
jgi:thiamine biosynthesis lipoprotein ApbE